MLARRFRTLPFTAVLLMLLADACSAGEIDDIFAAWNSRGEALKTIRIEYEGKATVDEGFYTFPHQGALVSFPSETSSFKTEGELLLDLVEQRLRYQFKERQGQLQWDGTVGWVPREWSTFLTSDYVKEYRPSERNGSGDVPNSRTTDLRIGRRPGMIPVFSLDMYPLLFAAGIYDMGFKWQRSPFEDDLAAGDLVLERVVSYKGRKHAVLRTVLFSGDTLFEYWVDRENPLRVSRFVVRKLQSDGKLKTRADIDITYREEKPGLVPASWRATVYMIGTEIPKVVEVSNVSYDYDVAVNAADFDIIPPDGTHVRDRSRPEGSQYYVAGEMQLPAKIQK